MSVEVERKWLVARAPELPAGVLIRQGYLTDGGNTEVRLRAKGAARLLTVKRGQGLVRQEVELPLDAAQFEALWPLTEAARVEKTRHCLPLGDLVIEVDVFKGALARLVLAEVEFPDAEAARAWRPPPWFGRELTGARGWSNADLAHRGRPPEGQ